MSADAKKSYGSSIALLIFGFLALYGGVRWLPVLVPAALFAWFAAAAPRFHRSHD